MTEEEEEGGDEEEDEEDDEEEQFARTPCSSHTFGISAALSGAFCPLEFIHCIAAGGSNVSLLLCHDGEIKCFRLLLF